MKFPLALQPYTVREELSKDYFGTLTRIAEIGYQAVELGPPPAGITIAELKEHVNRIGLQIMGCHARLNELTDDLDRQIDYLHEVGGTYIGLSQRYDSKEAVLE